MDWVWALCPVLGAAGLFVIVFKSHQVTKAEIEQKTAELEAAVQQLEREVEADPANGQLRQQLEQAKARASDEAAFNRAHDGL